MQEIFQQLLQILRGAWRHRWSALIWAAGACVVGWMLVGLQKDVFEAKARVYVDTKSTLRQLLGEQIVETSVEDQLRYVREALLGRPQLARLASETGLDEGIETLEQQQMLIDALSQSIIIASSSDLQDYRRRRDSVRSDDTYTITYQNSDRAVAVNVVSTLLDIFVEDTIGAKRSSSEQAGQFLERQLAEYESRLRAAEERLASFKANNIDRMPNQEGDYFDRLQSATDELATARQDLRLAESRLESIELQMRGEAPRVSPSEAPDPNSLEGRILENEARLDDLRLRYTESHPDVIAAREIVEELRSRQAAQYAQIGQDGGASVASNNPVFQALQISRNEVASEVATLRANVAERERRVADLRELINEIPQVEAELARLTRDYDVERQQYQALLDSLQRERLTREVVQNEQVEFRIIDPPVAGLQPVAPPRALLMLVVLMGSLGLGAGVAYVKDQLSPVFQSSDSLERGLGVPVLGAVSRVWSDSVREARIRTVGAFAFAVLGLVVINLGVLVFEVYFGGIRGLLT